MGDSRFEDCSDEENFVIKETQKEIKGNLNQNIINEDDEYWNESDEVEFEDDYDDQLNHLDQWNEASGDFTKQYNKIKSRLNQLAISSPASGASKEKVKEKAKDKKELVKEEAGATNKSKNVYLDQLAALSKFSNKINLGAMFNTQTTAVGDGGGSRKAQGYKHVNVDKADRATTEQVLDPRTRIILFKMLNRNLFTEVNGCISTGKEANVYHASTEEGGHLAIKIYKTSILTFKDRDKYVTGEYRFRNGYSKSNPRKMVKVWAEKELRNLKRLQQADIPSPKPILLRMHVLVMEFLGDDKGWAYPRLKDANISADRFPSLYLQLVKIMRKMYHVCKLVHADLSEYNLLYHHKKIYVIDVSQSVEQDHPHAFEFLRSDCTNITDFFRKRNVAVMTVKELFQWVVDPNLPVEDGPELDEILEGISVKVASRSLEESKKLLSEEEVFKQTYIPRHLEEVINVEGDLDRIEAGKGDELTYTSLLKGVNISNPIKEMQEQLLSNKKAQDSDEAESEDEKDDEDDNEDDDEENIDSDKEGEDSDEDSDEWEEREKNVGKGKRYEDPELKKQRKKEAKEQARESRKTKIPKAVKKRKEKLTSTKKGKKK
ncbi:Serine/threonine-protein kinase Rio1 [Neoconidiobolus thromboides FSU 785]|nr:Serine/threonine-protein kinase Rio1 [Neoconidiobolus thromboides FSU 785]